MLDVPEIQMTHTALSFVPSLANPTAMENVTFGKPEPFSIPLYDFKAVQTIARATNLESYYANLLDDAFERNEDDFTYGLSPNVTKKLVERLQNGYDWTVWEEKIKAMGDHHKVRLLRKLSLQCAISFSGVPF